MNVQNDEPQFLVPGISGSCKYAHPSVFSLLFFLSPTSENISFPKWQCLVFKSPMDL